MSTTRKAKKQPKMRSQVAYEMLTSGLYRSRQHTDRRKEASRRACRDWRAR